MAGPQSDTYNYTARVLSRQEQTNPNKRGGLFSLFSPSRRLTGFYRPESGKTGVFV